MSINLFHIIIIIATLCTIHIIISLRSSSHVRIIERTKSKRNKQKMVFWRLVFCLLFKKFQGRKWIFGPLPRGVSSDPLDVERYENRGRRVLPEKTPRLRTVCVRARDDLLTDTRRRRRRRVVASACAYGKSSGGRRRRVSHVFSTNVVFARRERPAPDRHQVGILCLFFIIYFFIAFFY